MKVDIGGVHRAVCLSERAKVLGGLVSENIYKQLVLEGMEGVDPIESVHHNRVACVLKPLIERIKRERREYLPTRQQRQSQIARGQGPSLKKLDIAMRCLLLYMCVYRGGTYLLLRGSKIWSTIS